MSVAKKILKTKPNSAAAFMIQGDAYRALGKPEKAAESYMSASESASMYLEPLKKLADLHKDQGNMEEQLSFLEKLDHLSPLNVERKVDMGDIHMQKGDRETAEQYFGEAVKHAMKEAQDHIDDVKRSIAERCIEKEPQLAEKFFRSIIDSKRGGFRKSDIETFNRLGIALRRQGKWQDAVAEYDKALKVSPKDENLHFNKAIAYMEGGDHHKAAKAADKTVQINPEFNTESIVLSFNLGVMYYNAKRYEDSMGFLKQALELDPKHEGAKKLLQSLSKYKR
jgi:tetratricopeptide (TPR) repeat protein